VIAWARPASMEAMLEETIRYTRERMVFGKPLFEFQNTRFKLAEIKARARPRCA
jgi:acyl-CoA dehydrogenase